jgi:hypothetical protein
MERKVEKQGDAQFLFFQLLDHFLDGLEQPEDAEKREIC